MIDELTDLRGRIRAVLFLMGEIESGMAGVDLPTHQRTAMATLIAGVRALLNTPPGDAVNDALQGLIGEAAAELGIEVPE